MAVQYSTSSEKRKALQRPHFQKLRYIAEPKTFFRLKIVGFALPFFKRVHVPPGSSISQGRCKMIEIQLKSGYALPPYVKISSPFLCLTEFLDRAYRLGLA